MSLKATKSFGEILLSQDQPSFRNACGTYTIPDSYRQRKPLPKILRRPWHKSSFQSDLNDRRKWVVCSLRFTPSCRFDKLMFFTVQSLPGWHNVISNKLKPITTDFKSHKATKTSSWKWVYGRSLCSNKICPKIKSEALFTWRISMCGRACHDGST